MREDEEEDEDEFDLAKEMNARGKRRCAIYTYDECNLFLLHDSCAYELIW